MPGAVASVKVDESARLGLQGCHCIIDLGVAVGSKLGGVRIGRIAAVTRQVGESVWVQNNDDFVIFNLLRDSVDPGLVGGGVLCTAGGVAAAITSGDVLEHDDRHRLLRVGLVENLLHLGTDVGGRAAGEPNSLRGHLHGCD